jgi:phospholipid/cholesterol/gamma-HCH transport system substrate-binding protein
MESRPHAFAAGLFTLTSVAALVAASFWLTRPGGDERVPFVIVSDAAVSGLAEQAPVRYLGVEVGRVERIRLDPARPRRVVIRISVDPAAQVTDRTYAQLDTQGVTGRSFVRLQEEDGIEGRPLATDPRSPTEIPLRAAQVEEGSASGQAAATTALRVLYP